MRQGGIDGPGYAVKQGALVTTGVSLDDPP